MTATSVAREIRRALLLLAVSTTSLFVMPASTQAEPQTEQQVKAGYVFKFAHFVDWPTDSYATPTEPFVIGVLGGDAFAIDLEAAVRDERLAAHPLVVQRLDSTDGIPDCRILYIDRSLDADLARILAQLRPHGTLTVSDLAGAAARGVAIEMTSNDSHVQLVINETSAHDAGLTISSNLLRLAAGD
jgi:hypothetical protein